MAQAGGLDDVAALSVGGQQHGMVCLDAQGRVVRPALLWNDTRSAQDATDLVHALGDGDAAAGAAGWADAVGSVPVASITVSKLRWLARHEPEHAGRVAAVALPHDWLTLASHRILVDRHPDHGPVRRVGDRLLRRRPRHVPARPAGARPRRRAGDSVDLVLPRVLGPDEAAGVGDPRRGWEHLVLGPGCRGQRRCRTRPRARGGAGLPVDRHLRGGVGGVRHTHRGPIRGWSPASPTRRDGSSRWRAPSTAPGCSMPFAASSASTTPSWPSRPLRGTGRGRPRARALSGGGADPQPPVGHRVAPRAHPGVDHSGQPRPGRRRRAPAA